MSKTLEGQIAERAHDLLSRGWTQVARAVDELGDPVSPTSDRATQFCIIGAVERAAWDVTGSEAHAPEVSVIVGLARSAGCPRAPRSYFRLMPREFVRDAEPMWYFDWVFKFNDERGRTCSEVLTLFDRYLQSRSQSSAR